jgi:hypothetical protein
MLSLESLSAEAWRLWGKAHEEELPWLVRPSAPVLFFGDSKAYERSPLKVITVGLNPSRKEFPPKDPYARFPGARGLYPGILNGEGQGKYLETLDAYFRTAPYTAWFRPAFESVLLGMDASYFGGARSTALHTDLCSPLPTDPTWSKLGSDRLALEEDGVKLWHELVVQLNPDIVVISIARHHLDKIRFSISGWERIYRLERKNPYIIEAASLQIDGARPSMVVFGKAAQKPFGVVSGDEKMKIGAIIRSAYESI